MNKIELVLTLYLLDNLGKKLINKFLDIHYCISSIEELYILIQTFYSTYRKVMTISLYDIKLANNKAKEVILYCNSHNINILTKLHDSFPKEILYMNNNPFIIFYKGNFTKLFNNKSIGIIGSRNPSIKASSVSYEIACELSKNNITIISGLSKGCDKEAHEGAINFCGNTIAVLPCGINNIYPSENSKIVSKILASGGCLISEYLPLSGVSKYKLLERNHLISAISLGIICIELKDNSGTLRTIEYALKCNKPVGYFPSFIKSISFNNKSLNIINNIIQLSNELSLKKFLLHTFSLQGNLYKVSKINKSELYEQLTFKL